MKPRREEIGIFTFQSYASLGGDDTAEKVSSFNAWVNERLSQGARVKSVTQCAAGTDNVVATTITVVIEYA